MINAYPMPIRYRLLSQFRGGDTVRIVDLADNREFSLPAHKIACDNNMIAHFTPLDACAIGYIVGARSEYKQAKQISAKKTMQSQVLQPQTS